MTPTTTVYITKYALTEGIRECTVNEHWTSYCDASSVYVDWPGGRNNVARFSHLEFHRTRESAVYQANQMRDKKIASLKRQIAKLEGMHFS